MAQVDLQHVSQLNESAGGVGGAGSDWTRDSVRMGLMDYTPSVEWALLGVAGERHQTSYECCPGVYYPDLVRAISKTLRFLLLFIAFRVLFRIHQ